MPRARLGFLAACAIVALAGVYYFFREGALRPGKPLTEVVDRGPIIAVTTATGTVNPVTTVQVGTYVSGPILEIDADFNSPVKKGQRVARIDPGPFQMRLDAANANLATARARARKSEADLALKRRQLERQQRLHEREASSVNDLDIAQSAFEQAVAQLALDRAGVQQVEASLREARINLGYTDIVSPVDGVVVARNVDVGQTVAASFQTPTLFLIARDLAQMQVNANVSESDIGNVKQGQRADFSVDAYPGRSFEGRIVQVRNSPKTVQNVVTYDVVIGVDNDDLALKPGMTATVMIRIDERADVVRVPLRALRFEPPPASGASATPAAGGTNPAAGGAAAPSKNTPAASPAVWVADPGDALRRVPLETGIRDERYAELVSGSLVPGDRVVVGLEREAQKPPATSPFGGPRFR
jgi:HlyD family secretion protein